jgi:hypothetical protein
MDEEINDKDVSVYDQLRLTRRLFKYLSGEDFHKRPLPEIHSKMISILNDEIESLKRRFSSLKQKYELLLKKKERTTKRIRTPIQPKPTRIEGKTRSYPKRQQLLTDSTSSSDTEVSEYEVERILDHRKTDLGFEYYIKWASWPLSDSTWELELNLTNANELLHDYKEKNFLD